jgi:thymidylate synthase
MNKYYQILKKVLADGKTQKGRKGESRYLLNETVTLSPAELLDIFEGHNIARKKLRSELSLFMSGESKTLIYLRKHHLPCSCRWGRSNLH